MVECLKTKMALGNVSSAIMQCNDAKVLAAWYKQWHRRLPQAESQLGLATPRRTTAQQLQTGFM